MYQTLMIKPSNYEGLKYISGGNSMEAKNISKDD